MGRTGTGFTQKSAQALYELLQGLRTDRLAFANALTSEEKRGLVPVDPKLVAEVEFRGWTQDRHLRHAAFKGLREDKAAEDQVARVIRALGQRNWGRGELRAPI